MEAVNIETPQPGPRPGPAGPDPDSVRTAFAELLAESAPGPSGDDDEEAPVTDEQVEALDGAHEVLARALTALDTPR